MFWADEIVAEIEKTFPGQKSFTIRDEKTASGRVHVGSLRGVVIHGVTALALAEKGYDVKYYYEINDNDPMDGMPIYLDKEIFLKYMGLPLRHVPSPQSSDSPASAQKNFARYFGDEYTAVIERLGFTPEFYLASTLYDEGKFDRFIDIALEKADEIRRIYKEISGSEKEEEWNPVQVVCEKCGRVGTTTVVESNGAAGKKTVSYICEPKKVKWAVGCGYKGKTAPYCGRGKLPWKVEWAAKWQIFPVHIEGAGKDHVFGGGSRVVAAAIAKEVFKGIVPVNIPYEFFTFGGAKMSASKGIGASAKEVADTLPEELLRFLMVRNRPEKTIDFDPEGSTMPRLYDFYDEAAEIYFGRKESDVAEDVKRAFHFSQLTPGAEKDFFRPRFSRIAFLVQMPQLNFLEEVEKLKGAPLTPIEREEAEKRTAYAKKWLAQYASENNKFAVQTAIPQLARELSPDQKKFLAAAAALLEDRSLKGENLHAAIHGLRKESTLTPQEGFQAIYAALLGKNSGPQAGWFLDALDRTFVIKHFKDVAKLPAFKKREITDAMSSLCVIKKEVRERFPGIKLGFGVMKGVKIKKSLPDLAALQAELWRGLDFKELKKNSPRLAAFCDIYRGFGVNPLKNKPSPLALITRLSNGKELTSINAAVDIYNALVVKHQLSIGLFDLAKIKLPIELRFARGGEKFHGLGDNKGVPLMAGELCYFDATGVAMARDYNYIDSELTKVDERTVDMLLNVDGNEACTTGDIDACLEELEKLLKKYCGGNSGNRVLVDAKL